MRDDILHIIPGIVKGNRVDLTGGRRLNGRHLFSPAKLDGRPRILDTRPVVNAILVPACGRGQQTRGQFSANPSYATARQCNKQLAACLAFALETATS